MKKIVCLLLMAALAYPMRAEEANTPEKDKKSVDYSQYLPQEGEFAIGFNLDPVATFVGNLFNGTVGNALAPLAGEPMRVPGMVSIMGTYMMTNNWGLRFNVGVGVNSWNRRAYVIDDAARFINPYSTLEGQDIEKRLSVGASASIGAEYRIGKRRVQGVFGVGLTYGCWTINRMAYSYYNAITDANHNPTNGGLYGGAVNPKFATDYSYIENPRLMSHYTAAGTHLAGVYGTVGVECFVAPKIALGLNVNVLVDYQWNPARAEQWEGWNTFTQQRQEVIIHDRAMNDGFTFTTDNIGANLYIAFYFGKK